MKLKLTTLILAVVCLAGCKTTNKAADNNNNKPLIGPQWNLVGLYGEKMDTVQVIQPFIVFDAEGNFNGNLGCNTFFGSYYQKNQKIELKYSGSTKRLCHEMATEDAVSKALRENINNFSINGNTLTLYAGKNEIMRFECE